MNHIAYLKRIRFFHYALLLLAVAITAFGSIMGGIAALVLGFAIVWKYHRCPNCSRDVDILLPLDKKTCCPKCGYYLKDGTEPEEMREAREQAEAEAKAKAAAEAAEAAEAAANAENAEGEDNAENAQDAEAAEGADEPEKVEISA